MAASSCSGSRIPTRRARPSAAIDAILDGMHWLGLDWDGDAWFQSRIRQPPRRGRARAARQRPRLSMLDDARRSWPRSARRRRRERRPFRIDSPWRDRGRRRRRTQPFVVRLKAPQRGRDGDRGPGPGRGSPSRTPSSTISSCSARTARRPTCSRWWSTITTWASPTSSAATTISTTPSASWRSSGRWAGRSRSTRHVPLIHGPDGAKLSKRHGALGVDTYRDELGILPEALFNYLLRLGWGHGDDEIISREQAVEWFDLDHVGRSPSRFDLKKLENLNGHYLREADPARLAALVAPKLAGRGRATCSTRAMPVLTPRAKDLNELAEGAAFLFQAVRWTWTRRPPPC